MNLDLNLGREGLKGVEGGRRRRWMMRLWLLVMLFRIHLIQRRIK